MKLYPLKKPLYSTREAYLFHLWVVWGHHLTPAPPSDIFRFDILWHFQFNIANTQAAELKVHPEEGLNTDTSSESNYFSFF